MRDFNVIVTDGEKSYEFKGVSCTVNDKSIFTRLGLIDVEETINCEKIDLVKIK